MKLKSELWILLALISFNLEAQQDSCIQKLSSFAQNINEFNRIFPQEKVYLHFDNTNYFVGETIWFKAYVVAAKTNATTTLSTILYLELVSPEGSILEEQRLKIENGQCHGSINLKDNLYAGYYEIRAYTRCMLNFKDEGIFSRIFAVYDKPKTEGQFHPSMSHSRPGSQWIHDERTKTSDLKNVNLTFYPEGGNLIKGIPSTIAFKATDKNGRSLSVDGKVFEVDGGEITTFKSIHDGMGVFNLKPEKGTYYSLLNYEGKVYRFNLPPILDEGYSILVDNQQKEEMIIQLQKSGGSNPEKAGLAITCRGELYYFETIDISQNGKTIRIPKKYFPTGVIQLTVFNTGGAILSSRMAFLNHLKPCSLQAEFNKTSYQPLDSIQLDFDLRNADGKPIETTFSLSVTDDSDGAGDTNIGTIVTNLLLSSELNGYIENPSYYFESMDSSHQKALDCLMLIQGWSRYSWKPMIGMEQPNRDNPIEKGILITGTVSSIIGNKPEENVLVKMWLTTSDSLSQNGDCLTDSSGRFNFLLHDFIGEANLSLQTDVKGKRKEMRIVLDRIPTLKPRKLNIIETEEKILSDTVYNPSKVIPKMDTPSISATKDNHLLKEVAVSAEKVYNRIEEGTSKANIVYDVADEIDKWMDSGKSFSNRLLDFLILRNEYFQMPSFMHLKKDIKIVVGGGKEYFLDPDSNYTYKSRKVIFVVNNNSVVDDYRNRELPYLFTMDQIETITISEDPFLWQEYCGDVMPDIPHVVIFIYTNKDGKSRTAPIGIRRLKIKGFSQQKEFYSPNYRLGILPTQKDFRRTLFWNPDVRTDSRGKAQVQFFNNATCTKMRINAETVTSDGQLISIVK